MADLTALVEAAIVAPEDRDRLRAAFPQVDFVFAVDEGFWLEAATEAGVIFAKSVWPAALAGAGRLRWVQAGTAGVEGWLRSGILERGVRLTNARGAHGVPIAEQVLAMALCFATRLALLLRTQAAQPGVAERVIAEKFELEGQTMLVVGLGDIGGTLARKADALGMRVVGVRRSGRSHLHCAIVHPPDRLAALLPEADHLALCLPLTAETDGLIGERELRRLKASAYLYNVGRGATVDGAALRRALAEGWIAGAGLDCLAPADTPAPDDPLWRLDNVILGRHTSGSSPANSRRITAIFMDNLARYLAGEPLRNVVDPAAGY